MRTKDNGKKTLKLFSQVRQNPTETNELTKKQGLTDRQLKAIPLLIAGRTITEGCEKAGIERTVYYDWLEQPEFKAELDRQRDEAAKMAFDTLTGD